MNGGTHPTLVGTKDDFGGRRYWLVGKWVSKRGVSLTTLDCLLSFQCHKLGICECRRICQTTYVSRSHRNVEQERCFSQVLFSIRPRPYRSLCSCHIEYAPGRIYSASHNIYEVLAPFTSFDYFINEGGRRKLGWRERGLAGIRYKSR